MRKITFQNLKQGFSAWAKFTFGLHNSSLWGLSCALWDRSAASQTCTHQMPITPLFSAVMIKNACNLCWVPLGKKNHLAESHWFKGVSTPWWLRVEMVKNLPTMQEIWVRSLGQEDPLEKGMATHSGILAWRIPWTEEPGGLQPMGSQRGRHDWATNTSLSEQLGNFKIVIFINFSININ